MLQCPRIMVMILAAQVWTLILLYLATQALHFLPHPPTPITLCKPQAPYSHTHLSPGVPVL